jgi:nitrate reductase gamma subunit
MGLTMYEFLTGPMAWIAFCVFIIGIIVRTVLYIRGLDWRLDRVTYTQNVSYGLKGAARSVFFWLIPLGTRSWRNNPLFSCVAFGFHFLLMATPVFLAAHQILLKERWGVSFFTLPEAVADIFTLLVILAALFFMLRRLSLPEVRILTNAYDVLVIMIAVMPFVTGFIAQHQAGSYAFWLCAHIISGEIMLMAIPFTKLSHFILFFLSRIQLGMDYGIKRGGMKGKGMAW